jgi:hypothetical protein
MTSMTLSVENEARRTDANRQAVARMLESRPMLVDVARAGDVIPGMAPGTILTSGIPLSWDEYRGGQRRSVLNAALYEGLASDHEEAERLIREGVIHVSNTQSHGCIGSVAGIYTASMPVLVVEETTFGGRAYCNLYEGKSPLRLNYGAYGQQVIDSLRWLESVMGPVLAEALRRTGPVDLKSIMARALRLGDELHSRNTAATMLFDRTIRGALTDMACDGSMPEAREVIEFLEENDYTFLRMGMAAAKAMADAAHGVEFSSVVTGIVIDCNGLSLRVSGLGDQWFTGTHPSLEGRFFDGFGPDDAEWIGGESCFTEVVGLGGLAQACAPTLQAYQGGDYAAMLQANEAMYRITIAEHEEFLLPPFSFRGSPLGIDVELVLREGLTPAIDGGLAGKDGGQIGAGVLRPELDCFEAARKAYFTTYYPEGKPQ